MASRTRRLDIEITDSRKGHGFRDASRDVDAFDRKIRQGSSSWSSALSGFGNVATAALGAAAVGLTAVGFAALSAVKAAEESRAVTRQTTAVLESMGNVAGVTADEVAELAEQLSLKSGIDDELIQSGENVLLTFRNIRDEVGEGNDIFTRATTAALDMSVALDQDLQSAITQVGKALNDPIAGLSALSRVGVQFTDDQKAMITALVESGDTLSAQKIILQELEDQFTGSAEAQATATDRLNVAFANIQEQVGEKLLPIVEAFSTWVIEEGIPAFEDMWRWIDQNVTPAIERGADVLGEQLMPKVRSLSEFVAETLAPNLSKLVREFGRLVNTLDSSSDSTSEFEGALKGLGFLVSMQLFIYSALATAVNVFAVAFRYASIAVRALIDQIRVLINWAGRAKDALSGLPGAVGGGGPVAGILGTIRGVFGAEGGLVSPDGIERFAYGGIAGRGRDTVPAMLTPGEMVLTAQDQKNLLGMIGSGRGGGSTVIVQVDMGGAIVASSREAQEWVTTAWNKAVRTHAGVNILPSAVG